MRSRDDAITQNAQGKKTALIEMIEMTIDTAAHGDATIHTREAKKTPYREIAPPHRTTQRYADKHA